MEKERSTSSTHTISTDPNSLQILFLPEGRAMKIAFVNQPIDTIIPPNQNSVGACTYWVARPFAKSAEVLVYGIKDTNIGDPASLAAEYGIQFRFFAATWFDRLLFSIRRRYGRLFRAGSQISTSRWTFPGYGRQVALDLKKQNCDVIHLQHCSQYIPVIRAHNPRAKIVLHLHSEWFSQSNPAALTDRIAQVDLLTTVGNHITEKTKRTFPMFADLCETTYNGIDVREFSREKDYAALRQRRVKRIFYSGAVSPHKGVHVLLDAFVLVAQQYPDVVLDIVGPIGSYPLEENFDLQDDRELIKQITPFYATSIWSLLKSRLFPNASQKGTYLRYLEARLPADVAGKVSFRGFISRSELVDTYYAADVFAFAPIWDEGFGLPPVEAMAAGTPVVTSRSGTVPETVINGTTGLVVEKNNVEELAQALLMLLQDDDRREAMGHAARRRALQSFSWDAVAQGMRDRYETLCKPAMEMV
jgi:glycosyltransferase involved in cell wall biosynthesis